MSKQEFLAAVHCKINHLSPEDMTRFLDYYSEMIEDRMEEGLSEDQAVAAMGTPSEVATQILSEMAPLNSENVKEKAKKRRALHVWEIVLLVVGSPVWAPLLLSLIIVLFSFYVVLWALLISLYAMDLGLFVTTIGCLAGSAVSLFTGRFAEMLFFLGGGLCSFGISVMLFMVLNKAAGFLVWLVQKTVHGMVKLISGKGNVQ